MQNISKLNMCIRVMRILVIILVPICFSSCDEKHKSSTREEEKRIERTRSRFVTEGVRVCYPVESKKKDNIPLISVFTFPDGVPRYDLAFVLWSNGRLIWSHTTLRNESNVLMFGGPPYLETYISEESVNRIIREIEKAGVFNDLYYNLEAASLAPDANYQMISIIHGQKAVCLIKPFISNEERSELLNKSATADKRRYKLYWQIDEIIKSLVPSEGKVVDFKYEIRKP